MLNLSKILENSVQQSFKLAFARNHQVIIEFNNNQYITKLPQTFAEHYKQHYQIEWKETLLPRDVAHEILIYFKSPMFNNIKIVSHIEITQMGHIQFQINKQYYEWLMDIIDKQNKLEVLKVFKNTKIYGPFFYQNKQMDKTDLRGIHIKNRLFSILSKLSENCQTFNKIDEQITNKDYLILPAKNVC